MIRIALALMFAAEQAAVAPDPEVLRAQAQSHLDELDYDAAREPLRRFLEHHPEHPAAPAVTYDLGVSELFVGEYAEAAEALEHYGKLAHREPETPVVVLKAGRAWQGISADKATDFYQRFASTHGKRSSIDALEARFYAGKLGVASGLAPRIAWRGFWRTLDQVEPDGNDEARRNALATQAAILEVERTFAMMRQQIAAGDRRKAEATLEQLEKRCSEIEQGEHSTARGRVAASVILAESLVVFAEEDPDRAKTSRALARLEFALNRAREQRAAPDYQREAQALLGKEPGPIKWVDPLAPPVGDLRTLRTTGHLDAAWREGARMLGQEGADQVAILGELARVSLERARYDQAWVLLDRAQSLAGGFDDQLACARAQLAWAEGELWRSELELTAGRGINPAWACAPTW